MDTVFDICLIVDTVNDDVNAKLVGSLTRQGYRVLTIESPDGSEGNSLNTRTTALLETLPTLNFGLLVLPRWKSDAFTTYAVASAIALGVPVLEVAETGVDLGAHLFDRGAGEAALKEVLSAIPLVADDVTPDEDRNERPHEEAARIVLGPRGSYYDHPYDNFARTGLIWTGVLFSKLKPGEVVEPEDVSLCMVGVKMAREAFRHKRDNLTDGHGYWMTHEMVVEERSRRERDTDNN